ncbi:MAG TPA: hypothetical protein VKB93_05030 [Thermoanaerobaculia bacterium]|nr:hypothetical protein [Thermoanaerobaculia bacterium]
MLRAFVLLAILLVTAGVNTQTNCCPGHTAPTSPPYEVIQQFPSSGPMQTAWLVHWAEATHVGLYITGAWFKRTPAEPWVRILWDARLSDIFVPYHTGSPRYYDLSHFSFPLVQAGPKDAGCCGTLLGNPPHVVREVRDRGPMWKDDTAVYRGEELVLWSTLDAANYNYIMQYIFRDDGTIGFRLGATARNLPGRELEAHMHNGLWRVDIDLAGFPNDSALLMKHTEAGLTATDTMPPFNGGFEGSATWNAEFTEIGVVDTVVKNGRGHNIQYDLMPMRSGSARHDEPFMRYDMWVTRYDPSQLAYPSLPTYVTANRSVTNTDVVLWYASSMHHLPRDDDGEFVDGFFKGSALVMWSGFDLRPRNFFDRTPFFP